MRVKPVVYSYPGTRISNRYSGTKSTEVTCASGSRTCGSNGSRYTYRRHSALKVAWNLRGTCHAPARNQNLLCRRMKIHSLVHFHGSGYRTSHSCAPHKYLGAVCSVERCLTGTAFAKRQTKFGAYARSRTDIYLKGKISSLHPWNRG